ncbi:hypothetical protein MY8738_009298, partial [Beauveria namnaoensis]
MDAKTATAAMTPSPRRTEGVGDFNFAVKRIASSAIH